MSGLEEFAAPYPTSAAVAEACNAGNLPFSALFARLCQPDPGPLLNGVAAWANQNPTVEARHFAEIDAFLASRPDTARILDALIDRVRKHAPHLWMVPMSGCAEFTRLHLFDVGGFLHGERLTPQDEIYKLPPDIGALREWISPFSDIFKYLPNVADCNHQADIIIGEANKAPHPRPQIGKAIFAGWRNGAPDGHVVAFTVLANGTKVMIEHDGTCCPLVDGCYTYAPGGHVDSRWTGATIQGGVF